MKEIQTYQIKDNVFQLIAKDWMLISAGKRGRDEQGKLMYNTMTANWGGMGYLWHKPVVFAFVRPERYTYPFMEKEEQFTMSFLKEGFREALNLLGTKSGRDGDKIAEAGLHPSFTPSGNPCFEEARLIMECKKLYTTHLDPASFLESGLIETFYTTKGNFHTLFIAEILHVWEPDRKP